MYNLEEKYLKDSRIEIINRDTEKPNNILYFLAAEHVDISNAHDLCIVMVYPYDWNLCMTPWRHFGDGMNGTGGGTEFMKDFMQNVMAYVENDITVSNRGIAGYSLGGLEALYMAYNMDCFDFLGSVSGSMWYPEAVFYFTGREINKNVRNAYISLGERENRTSNQERQLVLTNTEQIAGKISSNINTEFELNKGGHFTDISGRIEKCAEFYRRKV